MPQVAQFTLPTPKQTQATPASTSSGQTQSNSGMPSVAQFQLPKNIQDANKPIADASSFVPPAFRMGTPEAPTPQQGQGFLKGSLKGVTSTLQSSDVLNTMHQMAGDKTDFTGMSPEQRSAAVKPENPSEASGSAMTQIGAGMLPVGEGKAAASATKGLLGEALTGAKDNVLQAVMPRLTPTVASETKTATQGLLKKITPVATKAQKKVAETVRPFFESGATFSKNAENVSNAIVNEAEQLKNNLTSKNVPYIFKELKSTFNKLELPHFIKTSDPLVQKRAKSIIDKFMEIAKSKDGNLHSLLDARKEFDTWVQNEYPRVFDEGGNAVNQLVKNIRTAANDFIASHVPDVGVKESLKKQNLLYDALDAFKEKSALGEKQTSGEIGTTAPGRFLANHPTMTGILKGGAQAGVGLGLGATGLNWWQNLHNQ